MSMLFRVSTGQVDSIESGQSYRINFFEFLAESIHSQLVNFDSIGFFIFQSYLVNMFLLFNEENLQFSKLVLTGKMSRNFSKYMNFMMFEV